jgi:hypothetical protein
MDTPLISLATSGKNLRSPPRTTENRTQVPQNRRGAVSGTLLGAPVAGPGDTAVFHVQHHSVTESGETLNFDPATATTVPLSATLFAVVTYPVHFTGVTGKYAGAKEN